MPQVIDVPLNTTLADLDEALRAMLKRELTRHGFEGVEVAFDAPSRDWSGKLTGPTVNVFLYDLREAPGQTEINLREARGNGQAIVTPPPMRLEATYAITAWTKAIEDEHRLLSQVLAILFSFNGLPSEMLEGRLAPARVGAIETSIGRPMEEKADFWTAVGGQYKPSIDFAVRLSLESGAAYVRGPEVRSQAMRTQMIDAPRGTMLEMHRFGGTVSGPDGEPIESAWIAIPELGVWTSSNREGRFILDRVKPGSFEIVARTRDGEELKTKIEVPAKDVDLVLGATTTKAPTRKRKADG